MTDHEAMEAVNTVLDRMYRGELPSHEALIQIARISGMNKISHEQAKARH